MGHLLGVASTIIENGGKETQAIAGLLHDSPEDKGGYDTLKEIRERFGDEVADIVADCSDTYVKPKPPWKERKVAHIKHVATVSDDSKLVLIADKMYNLRTLREEYITTPIEKSAKFWSVYNGGRDGTVWYYRCMAIALNNNVDSKWHRLATALEMQAVDFALSVRKNEPELKLDPMP